MVGIAVFSHDRTDVVKFTREFTFKTDHQSSMNEGVDETYFPLPIGLKEFHGRYCPLTSVKRTASGT